MYSDPTKKCIISAPCKVNLHLGIGQRRKDGFHNVKSIFAACALSDTLTFEQGKPGGESSLILQYEVSKDACDSAHAESHDSAIPAIPTTENLVSKAISLFAAHTGSHCAFNVLLEKRIPIGAGLGGGSSDAASALMALNLLSGNILSEKQLLSLAACLGSDVPFFIGQNTAAFVSGRGERVKAVPPPPEMPVLLVKPPFSSDTAGAYRLLDEARAAAEAATMQASSAQNKPNPSELELIEVLTQLPQKWPFYNDFLPVFLERDAAAADAYREILARLRESGALFAGLSGSGSCCFGV
ncbi:MAG: 4-(cytidine 5'-diphospho)-2-C-methyl-D-erythritol kinase, partial [Treponema sp.]|nr:4-(cytidine 5'-diphospho)-2-C-methyl-D-erythritol kinase [Treponema sp.]